MAPDGKTVLAVIPARGGSKRVPRKNLREYRGRPLIAWAINAATGSKYIDKLVVSTEDEEIRNTAGYWMLAELGSYLIVNRPPELATDDATCEDVLRDATKLHPADWLVLLQPTSPLRTAEDIDACIERAQLGQGCISTFQYQTNGAVYVATKEWLAQHDFSHMGLLKYEMPEERSLDINEESD